MRRDCTGRNYRSILPRLRRWGGMTSRWTRERVIREERHAAALLHVHMHYAMLPLGMQYHGAQLSTLGSRTRGKQSDPTRRSPYLAHLANPTKSPLVLRMVLRSVEWAGRAGRPTVDGRKRRSANVEFGKLVELDVDFVLRATLALCLDLLGLPCLLAHLRYLWHWTKVLGYLIQHTGRPSIG